MGLVTDPIDYLTAQILKHALVTSTAAPLKKALADAQIGEDISATLTDGIHSGLAIIAKNTSSDRAQDFENVITTALMQLVNNGIDKDLIQSSINIVEYDMREASRFPTKGIIYHINSMQSWLYTDNPT
ncbi:insulinase family protein, partial [Aduncisulcus paluster]